MSGISLRNHRQKEGGGGCGQDMPREAPPVQLCKACSGCQKLSVSLNRLIICGILFIAFTLVGSVQSCFITKLREAVRAAA